jgi:hypothetical protein
MYPPNSRAIPSGRLTLPESAEPDRRTSIVVVREPMTLSGFIPAWEELAAAALEPNVFYEHWMLLPALEAFGAGRDICFVLVLIRDPRNPDAPAQLGGLFPLEFTPRVKRLQVPALTTWQHLHCLLCTPLVRADAVRECIIELFLWLRSGEAEAALIEMKSMAGDGPFHRAFGELIGDLGIVSWETGAYARGLLRKDPGAPASFEAAVSSDLRRMLRRKEARLSEKGRLERLVLRPGDDDLGRWIDEFLRLEASACIGRRAGSLEGTEIYRRYFTDMATAAYARGRLLMLGLNFDGRPIARNCALLAGEGSFTIATACDDHFARFSPGLMLDLETVRQLDRLPGVLWLDAGTERPGMLLGQFANDRRMIQSLAVGGNALGQLVLSGLPLLGWGPGRETKNPSPLR